jgi:transcriptional regulator with XRE-family HTH domain
MKFYIDEFLKYKKLSGLMSKAICEKAGVSRSALWQWEKGITVPSDTHVYKLAESLNIKVDRISDLKPMYTSQDAGTSGGIMELIDLTTNASLIHNLEGHLAKFIQYKNIIQNQNVLMNTVINSIDLPLYIKGTDLKYIFVNKMLKKILKLAAFKSQVQLFNKI